jgi:dihydrofolate reductase
MRKLIVWNVMSLDGMFEGNEPWALDFHGLVWGEELEALSKEQLGELDYLLFGRRTYDGMAAYWAKETGEIADGMNGLKKLVASRTLDAASWNNSRLLGKDVAADLKSLKAGDGGPIYVFGSADLLATLLAEGLVDEYRICIAPVLMGTGNPLFKPADKQTPLSLIDAKALTNGGVLIRYKVG